MKIHTKRAGLTLALLLPIAAVTLPGERPATGAEETRVPVTIRGGHETDPQDRGRPVALVAGALGVPAEVFRAAFRNVTPAPAGQEPAPEQVRRNKEALLRALAPHGVTNERLDTVSNYYRYNPRRGELWPTTPAAAYATVRQGVVTGFAITTPGAGYSSPPEISVPGLPGVRVKAALSFSTDFRKNGALSSLSLAERGAAVPAARTAGPDTEARQIRDAYEAARPADRDLGVFRLDWVGSLKEARERATREKRPIFFVATMQLKDAGNLQSGHC